jgi:hypothetical protein
MVGVSPPLEVSGRHGLLHPTFNALSHSVQFWTSPLSVRPECLRTVFNTKRKGWGQPRLAWVNRALEMCKLFGYAKWAKPIE